MGTNQAINSTYSDISSFSFLPWRLKKLWDLVPISSASLTYPNHAKWVVYISCPISSVLNFCLISLPSLHARWRRWAMGQNRSLRLTEWRLCTSLNHLCVHFTWTHKPRKEGADREAKPALWDTAYLSVWAACPSLGQIDGLSEAGRCQGSVSRGHRTEPRDEGMEGGSCISSNEKFTSPPTKGATTDPLAFIPFCLCVCVSTCPHLII